MKIKRGFVLREVAGQSVVVALGAAAQSFNGMIKLNATGKIIWEMLAEGAERDAIVDRMLSEYDVEREVVEADVDKIINKLKEENILE